LELTWLSLRYLQHHVTPSAGMHNLVTVLEYIDTLMLFILLQHQHAAVARRHDESNFAIDEW